MGCKAAIKLKCTIETWKRITCSWTAITTSRSEILDFPSVRTELIPMACSILLLEHQGIWLLKLILSNHMLENLLMFLLQGLSCSLWLPNQNHLLMLLPKINTTNFCFRKNLRSSGIIMKNKVKCLSPMTLKTCFKVWWKPIQVKD